MDLGGETSPRGAQFVMFLQGWYIFTFLKKKQKNRIVCLKRW